MKLLGWDTSSKAGAIVALEWPDTDPSDFRQVRLVNEWSLSVDSQHSEQLLWGVHQVLEASRWKLEDVGVFAVGVGPGSFTGLRIGVTTARTLSHTLGKPLIGVSSLAALARPAALWLEETGQKDAIVIASTDACKGELFALWGTASSVAKCAAVDAVWDAGAEESVLPPTELVERVSKRVAETGASWMCLGEGRQRYPRELAALPAAKEIQSSVPAQGQVQGRYLGMLAWEAYRHGSVHEALSVFPRYVRASDAEVKLNAGLLKRQP